MVAWHVQVFLRYPHQVAGFGALVGAPKTGLSPTGAPSMTIGEIDIKDYFDQALCCAVVSRELRAASRGAAWWMKAARRIQTPGLSWHSDQCKLRASWLQLSSQAGFSAVSQTKTLNPKPWPYLASLP